jgi:hypothetical protein
MKKWIINNQLYIAGAITGAVAGYLYYANIGCVTGTCMITSKPVNSTLYFALLGALLFGLFKKDKHGKPSNQ